MTPGAPGWRDVLSGQSDLGDGDDGQEDQSEHLAHRWYKVVALDCEIHYVLVCVSVCICLRRRRVKSRDGQSNKEKR